MIPFDFFIKSFFTGVIIFLGYKIYSLFDKYKRAKIEVLGSEIKGKINEIELDYNKAPLEQLVADDNVDQRSRLAGLHKGDSKK